MRARAISRCIVTIVFTLISGAATAAETFVGSTVESRVLLGFKVDDAAAAAWLPEGWSPVTFPKGPVAGANLFLVLMDRQLILDADGKPGETAANRAAAFLSYGRKEGVEGVRPYITRVFETGPIIDPYGNSEPARIERKAASEAAAGGATVRSESWRIAVEGAGEIAVDLSYTAGVPSWSKGQETTPYSAVNPEFHRIYRYDQLADLAMNTAAGKALAGDVTFAASLPDFAAAFDGTEELVAIVVIPVYVREVWLP